MENTQSWRGDLVKMEEEQTAETKPNIKAQIPFLADLIKLEQQSKKPEDFLKNGSCTSCSCKEEIIDEEQIDLRTDLQQPGAYVEDNNLHVKDELCARNWNCMVNSKNRVQESKSECDIQHSRPVRQGTFSETLSGQARNIEQVKEEVEDFEIIDGNIEDTAETIEERRELHLSIKPDRQEEKKLTELTFGDEACGNPLKNNFFNSERGENCGVRSVGSENVSKCDNSEGFPEPAILITHHIGGGINKSYDCGVYSKEFINNCDLSVHKETPKGERSFKCDVCGKGCSTSSNLIVHKRLHTGEKPFKCDVCGKGCNTTTHLIIHKRMHTGEKPFKCDVCGKTFSTSGNLIVHKRVHTGEKPFKCDVCGKGFSTSSHMMVHKRKHTEMKPYSCEVCGRGYRQKCSLADHKRAYTGEKPFKCYVCDKGFDRKYHLMCHNKTHSGERPMMARN